MYPTIINDSHELNMLYAFKLVYLYFICDMEEFNSKVNANNPSDFHDCLQLGSLIKLMNEWLIEIWTEGEDDESVKIQINVDWITPIF